jgi:hypothetical protein
VLEYPDSPCAGDSMTINGVDVPGQETNDGQRFVEHFAGDPDARGFEFAFYREGRDEPVLATVTLPEDLDIISPDMQVPLAAGFELVWSPAGSGTLEIEFQDDGTYDDGAQTCISFAREDVDDSGSFHVLGGRLDLVEELAEFEPCRLRIQLHRAAEGTYPTEFAPGSISAFRSESTVVDATI